MSQRILGIPICLLPGAVVLSLAFLSLMCSRQLGVAPRSTSAAYDIVEIFLGDLPDDVVVGAGHVWVTVPGSIRAFPPERGWLFKVDPSTNEVVSRIRVGKRPGKVLWAAESVWVLNSLEIAGEQEPTLMRVDPRTNQVSHVIPVGMTSWDMDADEKGLWLVGGLGDIARLDLDSMALSMPRKSSADGLLDLSGVASAGESLWLLEGNLARHEPGNVYRFDPMQGSIVARIPVGLHAMDIALGQGSIWVVRGSPREGNGTVVRIDARTGLVQATIAAGNYPFSLAVCDDAVWVTNLGDGTVSRIDPERNDVTGVIEVPFLGRRVACGSNGSIWITRETTKSRRGSLLHVIPRRSR